jgi:hypothetical protein
MSQVSRASHQSSRSKISAASLKSGPSICYFDARDVQPKQPIKVDVEDYIDTLTSVSRCHNNLNKLSVSKNGSVYLDDDKHSQASRAPSHTHSHAPSHASRRSHASQRTRISRGPSRAPSQMPTQVTPAYVVEQPMSYVPTNEPVYAPAYAESQAPSNASSQKTYLSHANSRAASILSRASHAASHASQRQVVSYQPINTNLPQVKVNDEELSPQREWNSASYASYQTSVGKPIKSTGRNDSVTIKIKITY